MIVYAHRSFPIDLPVFLRTFLRRLEELPREPEHDAIVDLLIDFGEAESGAADAWLPEADDEHEALGVWRAAGGALADAVCASWFHEPGAACASLACASRELARLSQATHPAGATASAAEGFAQYALYPEQYIAAADRFAAASAPASVACIGIRSIGAPLAHVVAGALRRRGVPTDVRTVRPRGQPFDRRLALSPALRRWAADSTATHFAIVDEGPGLSGSSFAAVSDALIETGVPPDRIVLFPSWEAPEAALRSVRGRDAWRRHVKATGSFEEVWLGSGRLAGRAGAMRDLSAGKWRTLVYGPDDAAWPAAHPQHERRKYLQAADTGATLLRFAGLGRHGRAKLARATALADEGFTPPPLGLVHGFLERRWIDGRPLAPHPPPSPVLIDRLAAYLACLKRVFPTGMQDDAGELRVMLVANAREALGDRTAAAIETLTASVDHLETERIAIDGRLLPHDWIAAGGALLKVDAVDHHADDFLPGCRDIAWDVAGTIVEFGLDPTAANELLARYRRRSNDRTIAQRLPFYEAAYLAFGLGYATLAAETLGGNRDGAAFRCLQARYRRSLAERVARRW